MDRLRGLPDHGGLHHPGVLTMGALLCVENVSIGAGAQLVQRGVGFEVAAGEVVAIVGASGCGKSTLLRHLVGLEQPLAGRILYRAHDIHRCGSAQLARLRREMGVMFQSGALWSSMTVAANLALPLQLFSALSADEIAQRTRFQLELVRLGHTRDLMPAQLSGGMRKRVAFARALMLEPSVLLLDEPGSGLDPLSAELLDDIILHLQADRGMTTVLVTHEATSLFKIADRVVFLDIQSKTLTAIGTPSDLLAHGPPAVRQFLNRGGFT